MRWLLAGVSVVMLLVVLGLVVQATVAGNPHSADAVLAGALEELCRGTRYNREMLTTYVPPCYRNGVRHKRALYPGGDVDPAEGVCSDLVVRALRKAGFDLQVAVFADVRNHPAVYDGHRANRYIDHRRVWILLRYFRRHFTRLPTHTDGDCLHWQPGDIVIWRTGSTTNLHIGIVGHREAFFSRRPLVFHNAPYVPFIFPGHTVAQDLLTGIVKLGIPLRRWQVLGHFRLPARLIPQVQPS